MGQLVKNTIRTHGGNRKTGLIAWLDGREEFPTLEVTIEIWKPFLAEKTIEYVWTD
jgi:hypothetical protein